MQKGKEMKKLIAIAAAAAAILTGCITAPKGTTGYYAGMTIHQSYTKIAEKQSDAFKQTVEALWADIDKIETNQDLFNVYTRIADHFDALIQAKGLDKKQVTVLKVLRKVVDTAITRALDDKIESARRENALKWLRQLREGIRIMRKLEAGEEVTLPDNECEDCYLEA